MASGGVMRRCVVAFVCVSVPLAAAVGLAQRATQPAIDSSRGGQLPPAAGPSGIEVASLDRQADPCVDFYEFACGGWRATHLLPTDSGNYGRVQEIRDRNDALLRRVVERPQLAGDLHKAADYYAACVDTRMIEATAPLRTDIARIDWLASKSDLPELMAYFHSVDTVGRVAESAVSAD
jgi:putative endopeptidase